MGKKLKILLMLLLVFMTPMMVNAIDIIDNESEEIEKVPLATPKFVLKTGNGDITVSISNYVAGVTYNIYRSTDSKKGYKVIASTTDSEYVDNTAYIGGKYYYRVVAQRDEEKTNYYTANKTNTLATTKASAKVINKSSVELSWNEVIGAEGYQVYRATSKKGKYTKVATTLEETFTNTKLTPGKKYYYKIRAYKKVNGKAGYSAYSNLLTITPNVSKPKYSVQTNDYNKIKISIEKVVGANGYQIYRATSKNGKYKLVKDTTGTSYVDSGLTTGKTYYYKVRAYAKVGKSKKAGAYNSVVNTKPQLKRPTFTVSTNSKDPRKSLIIKINKVAGATGYVIYRKEGEAWKKVATTKSLTYTDSKLILGTDYTYTVKAYRVVSKKNVYSEYNETGVTGKTTDENSDENVKKVVLNLLEKGLYSKQALINKLLDYGFDKTRATFAADTTYGEDNHKINYKEQALLQGRNYLLKDSYSEKKMRDLLKNKLYTTEEINYAINYMYYSELVEAPYMSIEHYKPEGATPFDDDTVRITFSDSAKGEGIELYYAEAEDARYDLVVSKTLYQLSQEKEIIVKVPAGKHYYYKVKAYATRNNERMYSEYSNTVDHHNELETPEYRETQDYVVNATNKSRTYTMSVDPEGEGLELYYIDAPEDEVYKLYKVLTKKDLTYNSKNDKYEYKVVVPHGKFMRIKGRNFVKYGDQTIYSEMSNDLEFDNRLANPYLDYEETKKDYNNVTLDLIVREMSIKNVEIFYSETEQGNLIQYTDSYTVRETEDGVGRISVKVPLGKKYYFKVRLYSNVTEAGQTEPTKLISDFSNSVEIDNTLYTPELRLEEKTIRNNANTINLIIPNAQSNKIDIYYTETEQGKYNEYKESSYSVSVNEGNAYIQLTIPAGKHYYFKVRTTSTVNGTKISSELSPAIEYDNSLNEPSLSMEEINVGSYYLYVRNLKGTKVEVYRSTLQGTGYTHVSEYDRTIGSTAEQVSIYISQSKGSRYYYKVRLVYEESGKSPVYSNYSSPLEINVPEE